MDTTFIIYTAVVLFVETPDDRDAVDDRFTAMDRRALVGDDGLAQRRIGWSEDRCGYQRSDQADGWEHHHGGERDTQCGAAGHDRPWGANRYATWHDEQGRITNDAS